jgi:hypothetical protein
MARRGRREVIDEKVRDLLVTLIQWGCTLKQAAKHVGIARSTLFKALKGDSSLAKQLREAQLYQDVTPLSRMADIPRRRGGPALGCWSAKTRIATANDRLER